MAFPPQLFLIGAQKSGTTQLATLLGQHPDICLANPKEPQFFSQHYAKGMDWYQQRFASLDSQWLLDASTSYSIAFIDPNDPDNTHGANHPANLVIQRIAADCGRPKFIYIMRNPVARTYSAYWHAVREGYETLDFEQALTTHSRYLRTSYYAAQINRYLQSFDRQQFLFLFFEEFVSHRQAVLERCLDFLDLDKSIALQASGGQNKSFVYAGAAGSLNRKLGAIGGLNPLFKAAAAVTPPFVKQLAGRLLTKPVPKISADQRSYLESYFQPLNQELEDCIGQRLSYWQ